MRIERVLLKTPRGLMSRLRLSLCRALGMRMGKKNRMEGGGRFRRLNQIEIGDFNDFTQGCCLLPEDKASESVRIRIGSRNYFNRNVLIDAYGLIKIGSDNLFGPDVYITDSNHRFGMDIAPGLMPMDAGQVTIGNRCWIGAKAVILKDVTLGDGCVVGAGAVVTKSFPEGSVVAGVPARLIDRIKPPGVEAAKK